MAVDGNLTFKTNMDTAGFSIGISEISKLIKNFNTTLKSLEKTIKMCFSAAGKSVTDTTSKTEHFRDVLDDISNSEIKIDMSPIDMKIRKTESEIQALEKSISELSNADMNLLDNDGQYLNAESALKDAERIQALDTAKEQLAELQEKLSSLQDQKIQIDTELKNDIEDIDVEISDKSQSTIKSQSEQLGQTINDELGNEIINSVSEPIKKDVNGTKKEVKNPAKKIGEEVHENIKEQVGNPFDSLKSALKKLAAVTVTAFGVREIINFGKQSIETASDMAEVQNVVDTAFGSMSDKMEDFADTSIKQFGISRLAAKQTGSTFMATASGMGLAQDSASDMAISLTGLSADMASFYNVEQDVASTALKSIFTGETETLKQFGIVMTDANLQAYALSQGISKNTSEMSQAEKVQLRYSYVMSQTALAQGDFAKTSDSWANQTRILSEQWKEFASVIGSVLVGVLLPAVRTINNALSDLIGWARNAAQSIADVFGIDMSADTDPSGALAADTAELADNATSAADSYSDMSESAEEAQEANENSLMGFDQINKLGDDKSSKDSSSNIMFPTIAGAQGKISTEVDIDTSSADKKLSEFLDGIKSFFKSVSKYIRKNFGGVFSGIWDGLKAESTELAGIFSGIFTDIQSLTEPLKSYLSGDFTLYLQTVFSTLGNIAVGLFDTFNKVFSDIWNIAVYPIINNFLSVGLPLITQFATQMWTTTGVLFDSIKQIFDTLWTEAVSPVLGFISQLWCDVWQSISDFWNEWGQPIFDGINTAITTTKDIFLNLWETVLRPIFDNLMSVIDSIWTEHLQPLLDEFLDFVGELITGALDIYNQVIAPIVNWVVDKLGPPVTKVINTIAKTVGKVISGIIDAIKGVITVLKGVVQFVCGVFTGNWKKAWQGIKNIFKGIWDTFSSIVKTPINLIIDLINGLTGAVENALNWIIDGINSISFEMPDWGWLPDSVQGAKLGFDFDNVDIPEIPHLAKGAVIPPNREFMAVLGDQKHGTNIEAPLDTITQAVLQALVAYGSTGVNGQKQPLQITLQVDRRTLSEFVIEDINDLTKRNGRSPIKV